MQALHDKQPLGPLALRFGLALSLLWSVLTKFTKTEAVAKMLGALGLDFAANDTFVILMGVFLLVISILLIVGKYLHIVGILMTVFFLFSIIAGATAGEAAFSVGPAIWKDLGLLGASLYFVFSGNSKDCCKV
jgi:uncharacterized membrane protein YphA (DoxX/SURF4 family)